MFFFPHFSLFYFILGTSFAFHHFSSCTLRFMEGSNVDCRPFEIEVSNVCDQRATFAATCRTLLEAVRQLLPVCACQTVAFGRFLRAPSQKFLFSTVWHKIIEKVCLVFSEFGPAKLPIHLSLKTLLDVDPPNTILDRRVFKLFGHYSG